MLAISFLSFLFFAFAVAAAPVPTSSSSSSSSSSSPHPTHLPTSSKSVVTHHLTHIPTKTSRPIQSPQIIQPFTPPTHTFTHTNHPKPTESLIAPPQSGQKPINIVFEVLGGLFAAAVLLGFLRCCYNYKKTPHRDRIADILQRHHLQRELEELERNPGALRRPSLREPAPPYFPRPPSYDEFNRAQPLRSNSRTEYSAVVTDSPSSSPPMTQRQLPGPTTTARSPLDLIPSAPSG